MPELLTNTDTYISLVSLIFLETVLGLDNVIFISILAGKLPAAERFKARTIGLLIALFARLGLLFSISWLTGLTKPLFTLPIISISMSGKDFILLCGGVFLVWKASNELFNKVEAHSSANKLERSNNSSALAVSFTSIVSQIVLIDIVFSLDSVITAVGLAKHIEIMVAAILISIIIMMLSAGPIGEFIDKHPSIKVLAICFLMMIGTLLVAEGCHVYIPKDYVYFSLCFALLIEFINIRLHNRNPMNR